MQQKKTRLLMLSPKKNLLLTCKQEFLAIYQCFSDSQSFSEPCTLKKLRTKAIPKGLSEEFVAGVESIRSELLLQLNARKKSITKIENLLARIRFIKLRYRL